MTIYLVDFENVRSEGLKGVDKLGADDKVVIFYSKNADAITFDMHMLLSKSDAEIETYRILRGGHNSLDFQLSTYLGYLVMENRFKEIVIISKDKGFLCVTNFWEENEEICNADIKLCSSIEGAVNKVEDEVDFEDGLTGKFIEKLNQFEKKNNETDADSETDADKKVPAPVRTNKINKPERLVKSETSVKSIELKQASKPAPIRKRPSVKQNTREEVKKEKKSVTNNVVSPNKVFASEVKLNITDDVRELVKGKCEEKDIPMLVETIGKSTGKQHFFRMVVSRMGQKEGLEIYKLIKGQYVNLKRK